MKAYRFFFTFIAVVLSCYYAEARVPKDIIKIKIKASAAIDGTRFNIDILKNKKNIKIVYSLLDSINRSGMGKDEFFIKFRNGGHADTSIINQLSRRFERYEVFTRDSINIKTSSDTAFSKLLDKFMVLTKEQLTIGNRIGLDGISISLFISTPNSTTKVSTWSPNQNSNPEIYQLITRSLDAYRKKNNNGFLDKKRTFNY